MSLIESREITSEPKRPGSLDPSTIRMVAGVGSTLDWISYGCTMAQLDEMTAPDPVELVTTSAAQYRIDESEQPELFALGASDACQLVSLRFGSTLLKRTIRSTMATSSRERLDDTTTRWCREVSSDLAEFQFGDALVRLAVEKQVVTSAEAKRRYRAGTHFALKRAVSGYRAVLERRTRSFLAIGDPSAEQMSAAVMLFVAVTGTTSDRIRQDLGAQFAPVLKKLDDNDFIRCADGRRKPALLLTPDGVAKLRTLVAKHQPAHL